MPISQRFYRHLFIFVGVILAVVLLVQPVSIAESSNDWVQQKQGRQSWIDDRADLLDWQSELQLSLRINKLVGRTSAEFAIATLPKIAIAESPRAFAIKLFNTLGVGKRETNNGVLLLVSQNDRRIEIVTGKSLREVLPDREISDLIQQEIVPSFQEQQYARGITQGVNAIAQRLELRLPSTIFPNWMPMFCLWIPWLIAIGGAGWMFFVTVQVLSLSFTPVTVPIPTQGLNTNTFSSAEILANYSFPALLAKVASFKSDRSEAQIPNLMINLVASGWILGIGLMYGFWQFVLSHPEAEFWQDNQIVVTGFVAAGTVGWLWGLMVSKIISRDLPWISVALSCLTAALLALLSGAFGCLMTTAWSSHGLTGMVLVAIVAALDWAILIHPYLSCQRQRDYRSERTGQPPQELTDQELESVLTSSEILARSMGKLEFRGWREAALTSPITREQVYLVQRIDSSASVCAHCKSYAVDVSEQTVERIIEPSPKSDRKRKKNKQAQEEPKAHSVRLVKQTLYSCRACGCVFAYDQREASMPSGNSSRNYSSSDSSSDFDASSYSSSISSSDSSSYDSSFSNDYGSSSSDFGGGSSDGGGAGADW